MHHSKNLSGRFYPTILLGIEITGLLLQTMNFTDNSHFWNGGRLAAFALVLCADWAITPLLSLSQKKSVF